METTMSKTIVHAVSLCLILAIAAVSPAIARKAMSMVDEGDLATFADRLNILPFSTLPEKSVYDVTLEVSPGVDKRVIAGGRICSGFPRPKTRIALLAERIVAKWDVDGDLKSAIPNAPRAILRISSAVSTQRCVLLNEYDTTCYLTTRLSGEIETQNPQQKSAVLQIESETVREVDEGILCSDLEDLPRGPSNAAIWSMTHQGEVGAIAVINREAIINFISKAKRQLIQAQSAQSVTSQTTLKASEASQ
jgi:hypothetical protein